MRWSVEPVRDGEEPKLSDDEAFVDRTEVVEEVAVPEVEEVSEYEAVEAEPEIEIEIETGTEKRTEIEAEIEIEDNS